MTGDKKGNKQSSYIFRDRLRVLRKEKHLSQQDVANHLGIPRSTYSGYEKGIREAGYKTLVNLAKLFDVSVDYLLGKTDECKVDHQNIATLFEQSNLHWNGIVLEETDLKLIRILLEKIVNGTVRNIQ